ncbi:TetR/AcrR family transcriptional regulator [Zavarzinia compransoris]|uniref:TetR family transcriptional regulator n=1 Tax=Zavarzinia compransoris TaxID=1264899 RepID=A0A317E9A4_9PROT|nr:TetR/AcrR family transcriptional regulator [Zavarzinia compransoris]PWR23678.1 TetR family transcriptional regulator [Zavarzinia compransoris]TDP47897.1 TetR family transcriptional regulator [Zavarzinia compransoris]
MDKRQPYHHGNLREALIAAALDLSAAAGPEQVSLREVARRAGVSSAAPFRHFADRTALMTAVAEEAMRRLGGAVAAAMAGLPADAGPGARLKAMGRGYLAWVRDNPAHFRIVAARGAIDFAGSAVLTGHNDALQAMLSGIIAGLPGIDVATGRIAARALVYGLARMEVDGHFPSWGIGPAEAEQTALAVLDLFVDGLLARAGLRPGSGAGS